MKADRTAKSPASFRKKLYDWYRNHHRDLPWRKTRDPYRIWVSEIMLQQTTVQAVIPYYNRWMKIFPDMKPLSRAPFQKVLKTWQGLGYYQRAKNMHRAAGIMIDRFGGKIPRDYEVLRSLPGFGPYTTAAVLSLAYDQPFPVIDTNVRRILMRLKGFRHQADPKYDGSPLEFLDRYLPKTKLGRFNQSLMDLGALICRPRNPRCLLCPVTEFCKAFAQGIQEVIPTPMKRTTRKIEAVLGIIRQGNRCLIQKRPSEGLFAELWEFPGGKVKKGETRGQALSRELHEELGVEVLRSRFLISVFHAYTQFQVDLFAYEVDLKTLPIPDKNRRRWVTPRGMDRFPFPSGSAKIVRLLRARDGAKD